MTDPFLDPTLSPSELADLTEPTPELQRNYRAREMLDDIGTAGDNGRWKYSLRDVVAIWISDKLCWGGHMDRRTALRRGSGAAEKVINAFLAWRSGGTPVCKRYIVLATGAESGAHSVDNLSELDGFNFYKAEVMDLWELAKDVPEEIGALLSAASHKMAEAAGVPSMLDEAAD